MSYGIMAQFKSPAALITATKAVVNAGHTHFDTYTPFPVHGIEKAMKLPASKLPWLTLGGGITGALVAFGLQTWTAVVDYPIIISGKPHFSYQAFAPVTFELMVLFSAFATVFGMFAMNKLPQLYHPVFTVPAFKAATCDGFFLVIESRDPLFDQAHATLESVDAMCITPIEATES